MNEYWISLSVYKKISKKGASKIEVGVVITNDCKFDFIKFDSFQIK